MSKENKYLDAVAALSRLSSCIKKGHDLIYCIVFSGIKYDDGDGDG